MEEVYMRMYGMKFQFRVHFRNYQNFEILVDLINKLHVLAF